MQGRRTRAWARIVAVVALALCAAAMVGAPPVAAKASHPTRAARARTASADPTGPVTSLATGADTSCAVASGEVWCWGSNSYGQLGDGSLHHQPTPVRVQTAGSVLAGAQVTQVAVGAGIACALTSTGGLACWSTDAFSKTGSATTSTSAVPVTVSGSGALAGKVVAQVSAMNWHVCARTTDSTIACWGYNGGGGVGDGTTTQRSVPTAVAVAGTPLAGKAIASVDVGYLYSCALATDGTIGCWGENSYGQLGNGTTTSSSVPVSPTVAGTALAGKVPVEVVAGMRHTCARSSDGSIACWGSGANGGLGQGSTASSSVAVPVTIAGTDLEGETVVQLDAGAYYTCARTTSGKAFCWGSNQYGQLGIGSTTNSLAPVEVDTGGSPLDGLDVTAMGVGMYGMCAAAGEALACWGLNKYGRVGDGTSGVAVAPAPAAAGSLTGQTVAEVDGNQYGACARTTAGAIACWGDNTASQVTGAPYGVVRVPTSIPLAGTPLASSAPVDLDVGGQHACAVAADGSVTCWGENGSKQLGRTGLTSNPAAVVTTGSALAGKTVVEVEGGASSTCARTSDGAVACWGSGSQGQLGNGGTTGTATPTAITTAGTPLAGKAIVDLAASNMSVCALASDSTIACWGDNGFGQLGNGTTTSSLVPTAVTIAGTPLAGKAIAHIEMGESDTACALATDGTFACWGEGSYGSLGDGLGVHSKVPVAPALEGTALEGKQVAEVSPGYIHVCVRTTDSVLACAGNNGAGSIGDGGLLGDHRTFTAVATAGTPLDGATIAQVASTGYTSCALTTAGVVSCWGTNWRGELGNGSLSQVTSPVGVVGFAPTITVPGQPTAVTATAGDGQVSLSWTAPSSDGGAAIEGYDITPYVGAVAQPTIATTGTGTTKDVTGLANGTTYTFTVAARNSEGAGEASDPSDAVTPRQASYPFPSWGAFVDRLYQDMVGAAPPSAERTAWVAQLTNHTKEPGDVVAALRATADNTSRVDSTVRLYRALLGRAPDAGGLKFWIGRRRSGNWTLNRMATSFSSSSEFTRKYGSLSNQQFVTQIYTDVLGRAADASGVAYWTKKLDTGARTRGTVMVGFSESSEYKRKQVENTDVSVDYIFLLGRVPTGAESADWTTREKAGTTQSALVQELLESSGYATHILGS